MNGSETTGRNRGLWKNWWGRLPRLSRGRKLLINLVVIVLAALGLWGLAGYPLPTAELEFRRLERTWLEGRSEIVLSLDRGLDVQARDGSWHQFTRPMVVGVQEDQVLVGYANRADRGFDTLRRYPLPDGPGLVPLDPNLVSWVSQENEKFYALAVPLLLVGVPQEAASGTLELVVLDPQGQSRDQTGPLSDLGGGLWLAALEPPWSPYSSDWYQGGAYTLRLYDQAGALLLEQEGTVPGPL